VLLADTLAACADETFALPPADLPARTAWLGLACYTRQIYFDSSGYSDLAIGLAKLFGFDFAENFRHPYAAASVTEFWRRWHISLSSWFRDYLFFPVSRALLRGTDRRHPEAVRAVSYVLTMGLIGLWHGPTAALVLWGLYHAALLIVFHATRPKARSLWGRAQRPLTFLAVTFGWVLFRSADVAGAMQMWGAMAGLRGFERFGQIADVVGLGPLVFLLAVVVWLQVGPDAWSARLPRTRLAAVTLGVVAAVALGMLAAPEPFVYFRF